MAAVAVSQAGEGDGCGIWRDAGAGRDVVVRLVIVWGSLAWVASMGRSRGRSEASTSWPVPLLTTFHQYTKPVGS